jgi:hypothetical protein
LTKTTKHERRKEGKKAERRESYLNSIRCLRNQASILLTIVTGWAFMSGLGSTGHSRDSGLFRSVCPKKQEKDQDALLIYKEIAQRIQHTIN